jgi:hypothetical protein
MHRKGERRSLGQWAHGSILGRQCSSTRQIERRSFDGSTKLQSRWKLIGDLQRLSLFGSRLFSPAARF